MAGNITRQSFDTYQSNNDDKRAQPSRKGLIAKMNLAAVVLSLSKRSIKIDSRVLFLSVLINHQCHCRVSIIYVTALRPL
jgi:hypothetical protein